MTPAQSLLLLALVNSLSLCGTHDGSHDNGNDHDQPADGIEEEMKCVCDGGCESILEVECPWGLTLDVCRCCFVCSRGQDEPCGGVHGTCAFGLVCKRDASPTEAGTCQRHWRGVKGK